ncbi:MAG TPA: ABC transporter permease [Xanthobacteraceae bacterium]|jgi:NitT/TauT family transport system permease protein|nr:ABC transporter permease [Xanthobacteraceae bacterium]
MSGTAGTSGSGDPLWLKFLPSASIILLLCIWEIAVRVGHVAPIILPAPSAIVSYLVAMIFDGTLPYHLGITFMRILAGFLVSGVLGILLGVFMGMSRIVARVLDPWIAALYPLPKISLIPLLIIWLGTGEAYILTISAITAFFPVVISTFAGIRQTDQGLIRAARDLGANERQLQIKVVVPAAMPSIFSGLELGMGVTIILVVAAEMIGGSNQSGMGFLLIRFGQVMETEKLFAALIALAVFGGVVMKTQKRIEHWVAPWAAGNM